MARWFRFYEKKRGNRRTGSRVLGTLGEGLYFGVCFFLGCIGLALILATVIVPDWRVNHEFVQTECTVLDGQLGSIQTEGGTLYRPEIRIRYRVGDETLVTTAYDIHRRHSGGKEANQARVDRFVPGRPYDCWYDPADPDVVVLVRGYHWWFWLLFVVPVAFILIGGAGLTYTLLTWGKSAERRAVLASRTSQLPLFEGNGRAKSAYPTIPEALEANDSAGTKLSYRLAVASGRAWALLVSFALCVVWNGITSIFLIVAIGRHVEGKPDWVLTAFVVPFAAVGAGMVYYFVRQLVVATVIGPTIVEISEHPLVPGKTYGLFLSQTGRLRMNSFEVLLVCDEEASYRQGTNARTESQRVFQHKVYRRERFAIRGQEPLEVDCEIALPAGAMHSFKSPHNEVNWKVVVKGELAGWPDYERCFSLIVRPAPNGTGAT